MSKMQLLTMTVQISDSQTDLIDVYDGDDPNQLAAQFITLHQLDPKLIPVLAENILYNMNATKDEFTKEPQESVYDRLYKDFSKKQIHSASTNAPPTQPKKPSKVNYGEYLYKQSIQQQESKKLKMIEQMKQRQQEEMETCTYQPQISESSKVIAKRTGESISECLYQQAMAKQKRRNQPKEEKLEEECTFKPKINQKMATEKHGGFQKLYEQAKEREVKLKQKQEEHLRETHTFHPKTDEISNIITQGQNFYERQQKFLSMKQQLKSSFSNSEVQPEFRPSVGRGPEKKREKNAFDSLYDESIKKAQRHEESKREEEMRRQEQSRVQARDHSTKLAKKAVKKKLAVLFGQLDGDGNDEISSGRISLGNVKAEKLQILQPLLEEMREGNHTLNEGEFIEACLLLMNTLSNTDKHRLLE